ncbi:MAG: hypothetical protein HY647_01625 [Acidobacteria bacterium]|nr:hypothetical protein [Acidobacteriota bacterium]
MSILLIGKDWKFRALLRAQLLEEGFEVKAYETVSGALEDVAQHFHPPQLILTDLSASDNPSAELEELAKWAARIPTWLLTSRTATPETEIAERGFERVLFRPIRLGELVSQIQERLKQA